MDVLRKARMPWILLGKTARCSVVREEVERSWFCLLVRAKVRSVWRGRCERICCWISTGRVSRVQVENDIVGVAE